MINVEFSYGCHGCQQKRPGQLLWICVGCLHLFCKDCIRRTGGGIIDKDPQLCEKCKGESDG